MSSSSRQESLLRRRLQQEAAESRPAFSETLHRRILSGVERQGVERCAEDDARGWRRRALLAMSAAACFACVVAVGWRLQEMRESNALSAAKAASVAADLAWVGQLPDLATAGIDSLASFDLTPPPARLSSDAQLTAESLLRRLPVDMELAAE